MFTRIKHHLAGKRFGGITLAAVAFVFLMAGFGVASNFRSKPVSQPGSMSTALQTPAVVPAVPGSFAQLAKRLTPTVVNVKVTKVERVGHFQMPQIPGDPFGNFFKSFPNMTPQQPQDRKVEGAGSGVIISPDGYILTNNHVVEGAREVFVTLADKQEYSAKIVGRDPKTDLAVLKIEPKASLPAATLGDSDKLQVGDWVLAIGNPFGLSHTVTLGIVSAKGRVIGEGPYDNFIQTDASINPGNSGGPLCNMRGEVVGINTAIIPQGQGIGFAIPIDTAKPLIPQLEAKGEVTRGYLGVSIQSITPELAKALSLKENKGALVADVVKGSPAEKAGIQRGDVIVSYNKKEVNEARDLSAMVAQTQVGQNTPVVVLRNGTEHDLTVKIGEMPSEKSEEEQAVHPATGRWGLMLQDLTPQLADRLGVKDGQGVAVAAVQDGSPAAKAGIQEGDVILEVNRHAVHSVKEAKETIANAGKQDSLLLLVERNSRTLYIALTA
jgi:serine protease Do